MLRALLLSKYIILIPPLFLFHTFFNAQPNWQRVDSIKVINNDLELKNPWAGGLNFCQFSAIDLNLDGIKDLFVFDRTGNKISTFINGGTPSNVDYKHNASYQNQFPVLQDWALMIDYNCDGKEDIFCYYSGGIKVFKNTSNISEGLKFELFKEILFSYYLPPNGNLANIPVTTKDIPAITDIDNDGDLDILTIPFYESTVEYHKNMSKELYNTCDSLVFQLQDNCWGRFSESTTANDVSLNIACKTDNTKANKKNHALGACFLCFDADGDGDKDFAQGIETFSNYTFLTNVGNTSNAAMQTKDIAFPSYNTPINQQYFPCGYFLDVDNDDLKDLLISSSSANVSENFTSISFYKNTGSASNVQFSFQQNNFLQNQMIEVGEGAYPTFFDYDNDGLLDLFIGNYAYYAIPNYTSSVSYYKNIGTAINPTFSFITRDFANLSNLLISNLTPAFADLDADSDKDMLLGELDGRILYFENTAAPNSPATFSFSNTSFLRDDDRNVLIDVGQFSSPQVIDLNADGKLDLVIGARNGKLSYFENVGSTSQASFKRINTNLGGVNVVKANSITGYNYPAFFEEKGQKYLLVGSESGYLYLYDNISTNVSENYRLIDSMYLGIWDGIRSAPAIADINNDGKQDVVIGNYSGGISLFYGHEPTIVRTTSDLDNDDVIAYPNPTHKIINIKTKLSGIKQVTIINMLGEEIYNNTFSSDLYAINIQALNLYKSIFFIRIKTPTIVHTKRVLLN